MSNPFVKEFIIWHWPILFFPTLFILFFTIAAVISIMDYKKTKRTERLHQFFILIIIIFLIIAGLFFGVIFPYINDIKGILGQW